MSEEFEELNEEDVFFKRDDDNNLLPIWINVPNIKKKIYAIPLAEGEVNKLLALTNEKEEDKDARIIENHVIKPKLKYDDLVKTGKYFVIKAVIETILKMSGFENRGDSTRNKFPIKKTTQTKDNVSP